MALLSISNLSLRFGGPPLLDEVGFQIERGERICLLGRNGAGKSSFLKVLAGVVPPDGGDIARSQGLRTVLVDQSVPADIAGAAWEYVCAGDPALDLAAHQALSLLGVDADAECSRLSGGNKRRVLLAAALAREPDLILLDEPTNHLDVDTIMKLESELARAGRTLVFVTHDRAFARRLATRCAEVDRGRLISFDCGLEEFLERRDALLEAEEKAAREFDKKLVLEEAWLRQGVKARRTRNEGRVKALKQLRLDRENRRELQGSARLRLEEAQRSGDLVVECQSLDFGFAPEQNLVKDLDLRIQRRDRLGLIGPNGAGKSTLLRLLFGDLAPRSGSVRRGEGLQVIFMDQLRSRLQADRTVQETVGEGYDTLVIGGKNRHILAYLQDFLFSPERARVPVSVLSGGEQNRLLLALLFKQAANVLVLDEPTNDLDMETLDLLENLLAEYQGTLLVASHDRDFLNQVVTSTLWLDGTGLVEECAGGWDEALAQRKARDAARAGQTMGQKTGQGNAGKTTATEGGPENRGSRKTQEKKLSFRESRELEALPARLEALEADKAALEEALADPELYKGAGEKVAEISRQLEAKALELEQAYARWEELESLGNQGN